MQPLQRNIVTSESTQQTLFSFNSASAISPVMGKKVALDFDGGNYSCRISSMYGFRSRCHDYK